MSVALIALILWLTHSAQAAGIHQVLARSAGFAIAAIGLWRLGRYLAGFGGGEDHHLSGNLPLSKSILPVALAGGLVPCWDAVALVLLSEGLGRLPLGLFLLAAFSLGMASVLVLVGLAAGRFRTMVDRKGRWGWRFGLASSLILVGIGLAMLAQ